jgi:hypothetical protein
MVKTEKLKAGRIDQTGIRAKSNHLASGCGVFTRLKGF